MSDLVHLLFRIISKNLSLIRGIQGFLEKLKNSLFQASRDTLENRGFRGQKQRFWHGFGLVFEAEPLNKTTRTGHLKSIDWVVLQPWERIVSLYFRSKTCIQV